MTERNFLENTEKKHKTLTVKESEFLLQENERLIEEILVYRNSHQINNSNPLMLGYKGYGGLLTDKTIFSETEIFDLMKLIQILKQYFLNKFEYGNADYNFLVRMEKLLFENGTAAVFKTPNGEFYPVNFSYDEKDLDFYNNPKKIKIITDNVFNGKEISKDFVIIYNNSMRVNTLYGLIDRINSFLRSLVDIDNVGYISRPKWFIGDLESPTLAAELEKAYKDNNVFIKGLNLKTEAVELNNTDKSKTYQEIFIFNMNLILKFLGISTEDLVSKKERQTQLEITKQENYESEIQKDFYNARIENVKRMNEIGFNITLNETIEFSQESDTNIETKQEIPTQEPKKSLKDKIKDKLRGKENE